MTAAIVALAVVVLALVARDAWIRTLADRAAARGHATTALEARVAKLEGSVAEAHKAALAISKKVDATLSTRVRR